MKKWDYPAKMAQLLPCMTPKDRALVEVTPEMHDVLIRTAQTMRSVLRGDMMAKFTYADLGEIEDVLAKAKGK